MIIAVLAQLVAVLMVEAACARLSPTWLAPVGLAAHSVRPGAASFHLSLSLSFSACSAALLEDRWDCPALASHGSSIDGRHL